MICVSVLSPNFCLVLLQEASFFTRVESPDPETGTVEMQGAVPTCWSPPLPSWISALVPPPLTSTGTRFCTARVCALTLPSVLAPDRPRGRQHGKTLEETSRGLRRLRATTRPQDYTTAGLTDGSVANLGGINAHTVDSTAGRCHARSAKSAAKKRSRPSTTLPNDHSPATSPSSPCFVGTLAAALIHHHTFHQEPARSRNPQEQRGLDRGLQHPR